MKLRTNSRGYDPRRRAMVVVAVAVSLMAILGVVALSLDGGMLMDKRRQANCAADAAALAAADDMYARWWQSSYALRGLDSTGTAKAAALATASANGYT